MSTVPSDGGEQERWSAKKAHYQDARVVAAYDDERFRGLRGGTTTERKWRIIQRAIGSALHPGALVLDVPCGRGRFTERILAADLRLVSADLSHAMLVEAASLGASSARFRGAVQGDVECLPFRDESFELVMSIRFLFHVPRAVRPAMLRELARVSKRFVVVDVRHKYCWTTHTKRLRAWIAGRRMPERATLRELDELVEQSGLVLRRRAWIAPLLSEKMLLVCEKRRR